MDIIEALAACIMNFEGFYMPGTVIGGVKGSVSWRNRNPGNLRSGMGSIGTDDKGYAVYNNLAAGWSALRYDIAQKLDFTNNKHNLTAQSSLHDFFNIYAPALDQNDPQQYSRQVALMLTRIYNKQVMYDTKLEDILQLDK